MIAAASPLPTIKVDFWMTTNLICRLTLGVLFIYHGLVPKIIWLSEIEKQLVEAGGFAREDATFLSPAAGSAEVVLGLMIIFLRKHLFPVYIAAFSLIGLLGLVAAVHPDLLIEAFNPVTTNLMGLVFCYLIIRSNSVQTR